MRTDAESLGDSQMATQNAASAAVAFPAKDDSLEAAPRGRLSLRFNAPSAGYYLQRLDRQGQTRGRGLLVNRSAS